jgi:hypothetical protein
VGPKAGALRRISRTRQEAGFMGVGVAAPDTTGPSRTRQNKRCRRSDASTLRVSATVRSRADGSDRSAPDSNAQPLACPSCDLTVAASSKSDSIAAKGPCCLRRFARLNFKLDTPDCRYLIRLSINF